MREVLLSAGKMFDESERERGNDGFALFTEVGKIENSREKVCA